MPYMSTDAGDSPAAGEEMDGSAGPGSRPTGAPSDEAPDHQLNGSPRPEATLRNVAPPSASAPTDRDLTADDFRRLVFQRREELAAEGARQRTEEIERRSNAAQRLVDRHVTDEEWNGLLDAAREAAERGEVEFLLLRFPSELCSDGGRAINAPDPEWPLTLRGKAAELFVRWERALRPRRFHLASRVLEFPSGVPGDVGLFLVWAG